jgi:hypothetical protein
MLLTPDQRYVFLSDAQLERLGYAAERLDVAAIAERASRDVDEIRAELLVQAMAAGATPEALAAPLGGELQRAVLAGLHRVQ